MSYIKTLFFPLSDNNFLEEKSEEKGRETYVNNLFDKLGDVS